MMPGRLEEGEQRAVIDWWAYRCKQHGLPEFTLFHVPNGGLRHKSTAGRLKSQGVRRGIPDLLLMVPRGHLHGLAIEMKSERGRPTDAQLIVHAWMLAAGWRVEVCYSADAAINAITSYLSAST